MNIFKEMVRALYSVESYSLFVRNKTGKVFLFGCLIQFLVVVVSSAFFLAGLALNGGLKGLLDEFPDFQLEGGTLYVEEPFTYDDGRVYLGIDTQGEGQLYWEQERMKEKFEEYQSVILLDRDFVLLKSSGGINAAGRWEIGAFEDFKEISFSKRELYPYISLGYIFIALGTALSLLLGTIGYFLWALIISLFGLLVASLANVRLRFGTVYIISVYSMSWTLVTSILNQIFILLFGFPLPVLWLIHGVITLVITWFVASMFAKRPELLPPLRQPRPLPQGHPYSNGFNQAPMLQHPMNQNQPPQSPLPQPPMGSSQPSVQQPPMGSPQSPPPPQSPLPQPPAGSNPANQNLTPSDGWSFGGNKDDAGDFR